MNVENSTWILRLLGKEDKNLAALCLFITLLLVCKENCGLRIFFLMPKNLKLKMCTLWHTKSFHEWNFTFYVFVLHNKKLNRQGLCF